MSYSQVTKTRFLKVLFQVIFLTLLFTVALWPAKPLHTFAVMKAASQTQSIWKRFTGKDEEFSVRMPVEPALYINLITNDFGKRRLERIYSSYFKGSVYLVVSYDGGSIKDIIENFKAHHLYRGEATFERDVILGNFKGKQYRLALNEAVGTVQCFATKKHAYAVAILQANDDPPLRQYFLSSFSLTQKGNDLTKDVVKATNEPQSPPINQASDLPQGSQDADTVFSPRDVGRKAVVVSRPEPLYTEEARQSGVSGTVVLRAVLSASGEVTNIRVVSSLPRGLSERAIEAARNLKFIPAIKDGRFVSQYIQIEYNFGLY